MDLSKNNDAVVRKRAIEFAYHFINENFTLTSLVEEEKRPKGKGRSREENAEIRSRWVGSVVWSW